MTYGATKLYTTTYQKILNYRKDVLDKGLEKVSQEYIDAHIDGIDACLAILKSTHMIFDMDGDF